MKYLALVLPLLFASQVDACPVAVGSAVVQGHAVVQSHVFAVPQVAVQAVDVCAVACPQVAVQAFAAPVFVQAHPVVVQQRAVVRQRVLAAPRVRSRSLSIQRSVVR